MTSEPKKLGTMDLVGTSIHQTSLILLFMEENRTFSNVVKFLACGWRFVFGAACLVPTQTTHSPHGAFDALQDPEFS